MEVQRLCVTESGCLPVPIGIIDIVGSGSGPGCGTAGAAGLGTGEGEGSIADGTGFTRSRYSGMTPRGWIGARRCRTARAKQSKACFGLTTTLEVDDCGVVLAAWNALSLCQKGCSALTCQRLG
jgi:hypothetical protein